MTFLNRSLHSFISMRENMRAENLLSLLWRKLRVFLTGDTFACLWLEAIKSVRGGEGVVLHRQTHRQYAQRFFVIIGLTYMKFKFATPNIWHYRHDST